MKGQVGRCTAAYESKVSPYFTINLNNRRNPDQNHGGVAAFFERCDFVKKYERVLLLLKVDVDVDCELHCRDEEHVEILREIINAVYRGKPSAWVKHETL